MVHRCVDAVWHSGGFCRRCSSSYFRIADDTAANGKLNTSPILSCLIFGSSVEGGMPSFAAAPPAPATFSLLSARADSMISFS